MTTLVMPGKNMMAYSRAITLTPFQIIYSTLLISFGTILLVATVDVAFVSTWLIFIFITIFGLWLCFNTRNSLNDPKLKILGSFWLVKVTATLFLLYAGWIPQLDPSSSSSWGDDAQRFFQDAWLLVENNWHPAIGMNYQGVNFYYGAVFYLFGHNPVIPALINSIVTLIGTLFLIRCAYAFSPQRTSIDWTIALLLLVPEVLWYDVQTCKEAPLAFFIILSTLNIGRYLVDLRYQARLKTLFFSGVSVLAILAIRTAIAIPVVASIIAIIFFVPSKNRMARITKASLIVSCVFLFLVGPYVQHIIGGTDFSYFKILESIQSYNANIAAQANWGTRSIGKLFAPDNFVEFLLFMPPRMLMYMLAPLPIVPISIGELWIGFWGAWQNLMTVTTSFMMLVGFPFVIAGTVNAWRSRMHVPGIIIIPITFWLMFIAVAGGNIIIHERYRLMYTLLFFSCVWLGYTRCSLRSLKEWGAIWYFALVIGALLYVIYKFIA